MMFLMMAIAIMMGGGLNAQTPDGEMLLAANNVMDTPVLEGSVGKYGIKMQLHLNTSTHKVTGWYYYKSQGAKGKIQLSGKWSGSDVMNCTVSLTESVNGKTTGYFNGDLWIAFSGNCGYDGTWTSTKGKKMNFEVSFYRGM